MLRAERPAIAEGAARQFAGDRLDHRDVEELARIERRQDGGQALRQHGFAGAGWADHQNGQPAASWLMSASRQKQTLLPAEINSQITTPGSSAVRRVISILMSALLER